MLNLYKTARISANEGERCSNYSLVHVFPLISQETARTRAPSYNPRMFHSHSFAEIPFPENIFRYSSLHPNALPRKKTTTTTVAAAHQRGKQVSEGCARRERSGRQRSKTRRGRGRVIRRARASRFSIRLARVGRRAVREWVQCVYLSTYGPPRIVCFRDRTVDPRVVCYILTVFFVKLEHVACTERMDF